ncbi:MAG: DUF1501 domain-containing protein [Bacteroidia bacterium]|nr:DUF1501 domain-containing protein [Bacteroidia bacterium]
MANKKHHISRRKFLGQSSCMALGSTTLLSTLVNLKYMNAASMANSSVLLGGDYKALVCILLSGGCDSHNMLIPYQQGIYNSYQSTRTNLAIARDQILPLNGSDYGVHPAMTGVQSLYNQGKLSFISNIGTLVRPMTKADFLTKPQEHPLGLFSHADQIQQWQTSVPDDRSSIGWGGRIADLMSSLNSNSNISLNVSLSGSNIFQTGVNSTEYSIDPIEGSVGIQGHNDPGADAFGQLFSRTIVNMIDAHYDDVFKRTYINTLKTARDADVAFRSALDSSPTFFNVFSANEFSDALHMISRTIAGRDQLGMKRQIFFVEYGGWDHHDEVLNNQTEMLGYLSDGMNEFNTALETLNISDCVTTFLSSEFGRTLGSNGNGSDHAWGGNVMVMGGNINGGQIFGTYPELVKGSEYELGGVWGTGIMLPSTSVDEYFAELALWFGVAPSELATIFPNIGNFYDTGSGVMPIGFFG